MRKSLLQLFFAAFLMLSVSALNAQDADAKLPGAMTFKALVINYDSPFRGAFTDYRNTTRGVEIGYIHPINKFFNLAIPLKVGVGRFPANKDFDSGRERLFGSLDAIVQFQIIPGDNVLSPYVMAGAGGVVEGRGLGNNSNMHVDLPYGVGLNIRLAENVYANVQSEFRNSLSDLRNNSQIGAGLMWRFGDVAPPPPPDIDGDGIIDTEDDCPAIAGLSSLRGCPDGDGDGIADKSDDCPTTAGIAKFAGCPDSDNDGIKDGDDGCPNEAGPKDNNGCPILDADNDGVVDADDKCPNEAGPKSNNGCPIIVLDSDKDGIPDENDNCPTVAGTAQFNGCPDTDGDGVQDSKDKCPGEAGTVSNNGCPEMEKADIERLTFAMKNVQFNSSRATLKTGSNSANILDEIAGLMKKYPKYSLSISGHTDSVGDSASNQKLSENRAKTCYDFLVRKGISPSRMNYIGYGESQPIADNINKAGRQKNRRVEFNMFLK